MPSDCIIFCASGGSFSFEMIASSSNGSSTMMKILGLLNPSASCS